MSKKRSINDDEITVSKKRKHLKEINKENDQSFSDDESYRCGKIVSIHLTNFMCHSNLKIDFCRRVNLLIGANGSGKSAILTALIVGLGAKARDTNRSTSIKQLVKSGEPSADVEITILNIGSNAYEPEVYGNSITISRHILASGSSNYKIKDSYGNVVSKSVDDLHKILLYHNIQTDNPVFVLNQDSARSFLKEMDPSKNYVLFLKATQIETILEKLNHCGVMYQDYKFKLNCCKQQVELMETELDELREKRGRLENADEIKRRVEYTKLEQLWLKVQQKEIEIDEIKQQIEKYEEKFNKIQKTIEDKDMEERNINIRIKDTETEYQERNNSFRFKLETQNNLKKMCKEAGEEFEKKSYELKKMQRKIDEYRKQIEGYEQRIEERNGSGLTQVQQLRSENEEKLAKFLEEKEDIKILVEQQKRELDLMNQTKERQEEDFENINRQRIRMADKISSCEREILKIKTSGENKFAAYGNQMSLLINEIKRNQNRFSELPIGPLGQYIYVSDQKWRGPIEELIGGLSTCFIVNSDKDSKILTELKKKFNMKNPVITMRFQKKVYDVSSGMCHPPEGTTLLMNQIRCDNPVVMNCLIDRSKIETILLTEDQNLAISLTAYEGNKPRNMSRVILLKPFLEYHPAPMYRIYPLTERKPRFIQVNMEEIRKNLENEIEEYKANKNVIVEKLRTFKTKIGEIYRQINHNQQILTKHQSNMNNINEKIEEIKAFEYPEEIQIEFFKKEISELQKLAHVAEAQIEKIEQDTKAVSQTKIEKTKEYEQHKLKIQNEEKEVGELRKRIDDLKSELHSISNTANTGQQNLEKLKRLIENNNDKLLVETGTLTNLIETAQSRGDRVTVTKSEEELSNFIKKNEYSLKQISTTNDNLEDIIALIEDKEIRFEKFKLLTSSISKTLQLLKHSRLRRFKSIVDLKNHMALRVKFTFNSVLKIKNFAGNIEFDHKEQKLTLTVVPRDNHINNAVSNTKSLSGGERSFSTVALLLSLWSCVDHPFYFLDEYDVFTDQINREIMTKLLLSEADRKPHRQYTFLTPQDVSFVQGSDTIAIHRLANPRR